MPFPVLFLFILWFSIYSMDTIFILGDGLTCLLMWWEKSASLLSCSWIFLVWTKGVVPSRFLTRGCRTEALRTNHLATLQPVLANASYLASLHPAKPCPSLLSHTTPCLARCTLLSHAAPYVVTPNSTQPCRTLLSHSAPYLAMPHPTMPSRTLLSHTAP